MQANQPQIGSERVLVTRSRETRTGQMQDALLHYMPSFYRRAYRYLGNQADAEDAVQEAFLSACKHIDQFRGQSQLSTWLTAIVTNSALMQLRKRSRQNNVSLDEPIGVDEQEYSLAERLSDGGPSPEQECRTAELHGLLLGFVTQLSPPLRKAFQLRDLDGLSTSEAAEVLGVPEGTVKAQVARARAKLRQLMRRSLRRQPRSSVSCETLSVAM